MTQIIHLPGAAAAPVAVNSRPGRYPKNVTPYWKLRYLRGCREESARKFAEKIAKAQEQIAFARQHAANWQNYLHSILANGVENV